MSPVIFTKPHIGEGAPDQTSRPQSRAKVVLRRPERGDSRRIRSLGGKAQDRPLQMVLEHRLRGFGFARYVDPLTFFASLSRKSHWRDLVSPKNTYCIQEKSMQHFFACQPRRPEIAADLGLSTRQLERLFGRYMNSSPKKYDMELRLDRARNLLIQTEMSVLDVAIACGFHSAGHFSRVYRAAFAVTPMAQRGRIT